LFQQNSEEREKWSQLASSPTLHRAIAYAQAELGYIGFGPQHMEGVNGFIVMLLNLSENEPAPKPFPVKSLTSYDTPAPKPPTESK